MANPSVKSLLLKKLEKWELNEDLIAKKIKDGLNARTVPQREGGTRYDDQFTRKQFLDLLIKIRGDYAPERIEATSRQIQIIIDGSMVKALLDSKVIKPEELETIEGDYIDAEVVDGELDKTGNQEVKLITGSAQEGGNGCGAGAETQKSREDRGESGTSTLCGDPEGSSEPQVEGKSDESTVQP